MLPKQIEFERPALYEKQRAALYTTARFCFIEASTKAGKTFAAIVWLVERAMVYGFEGSNHWWVAPVSSQAEMAFRRIKRFIGAEWYVPQGGEGYRRIYFPHNGATIWFKSGDKPDSNYGEDVHDAVADEASRHKEDSWIALRSTLTATKGNLRAIGNIKGKNNWFYKLCRQAQEGNDPDMDYHSINAMDAAAAGVIEWEEIERAKAMMPLFRFEELYLNKAADDGGNPIGIQAIRRNMITDSSKEDMLSFEDPVCWGWDLAKTVDYTAGIALDAAGKVCRFERWQGLDWPATKAQILEISGDIPTLIDSTGIGDVILDDFQAVKGNQYEGFKFNMTSRQALLEKLKQAIQDDRIKYPQGVIVDELENLEYHYNHNTGRVRYSVPEPLHDDCVMSLALAVWKWDSCKKGDNIIMVVV